MTHTSLKALPGLVDAVQHMIDDLPSEYWSEPSSCPGWTRYDVLVHLVCTLREGVDPTSLPSPVPGSIERSNDRAVLAYRDRPLTQTLADYRALIEPALARAAQQQHEPRATVEVDLDDAGIYPLHLMADSLVFDHYCHLQHDLGVDAKQFLSDIDQPAVMGSTLAWLTAGIPQMSPRRLHGVLRSPVELRLGGPGGGTWVLRRRGDVVDVAPAAADSAARVTSTGDEFVRWGTARTHWLDSDVTIEGDVRLAVQVLDALKVF